jgi:Molybdopterin oxidoreductase
LFQALLADTRFHKLLLAFDQDMADCARHEGCACGGVLHSARFRRKPRGVPAGTGEDHQWRLSLCCSVHGCRQRKTPPSVRFLGRKVYLGVVVVLASMLQYGATPGRMVRLSKHLSVSHRTVARWRQWWHEAFTETRFWQAARAAFTDDLRRTDWADVLRVCGLRREQLQRAAETYMRARAVILVYGMGVTQHRLGTANVQQMVNLLLLRGNFGKPGAGICPVRGHSNVQGDRTVGIDEKPKPALLDQLKKVFGFNPPRAHVVDAIADHGDRRLALVSSDRLKFSVRQQLGFGLKAKSAGNRCGRAGVVAR